MNIALSLLSGTGYGGVTYFRNLIPALARVEASNVYHIFLPKDHELLSMVQQNIFLFHAVSFNIINIVTQLIPRAASVSIEQFLIQNVYKLKSVYVFPYIEGADYVLIDRKNPVKTSIGTVIGSWDGLRQNPHFYYDWVEKRPGVFELIYSEDGVFLYKRKPNAPSYPQPHEAPK